jgi:hypothetical protein
MLREIIGNDFKENEQIYIFELGLATFIESLGYSEEYKEYLYLVLLKEDKDVTTVPSSICFNIGQLEMARNWSLNTLQINLHYRTSTTAIHLLYSGEPIKVCYDNKRDCEFFREGDRLHNDWEGNGIEFNVLIDKWFRRLNGEMIPLSDYYHDPYNRWLDSLSDQELG